MNNIILIGFMGCGKTTVGKNTAEALRLDFVDTDEYIERKYEMRISEIFEKFGEEKFRDMETKALREVCQRDNTVISTGGGIIIRDENADIMKNSGKVFFINTPFETIKSRLKGDKKRPLLAEGFEKAKALYDSRMDKYQKAADKEICCTASPQVLEIILKEMKEECFQ